MEAAFLTLLPHVLWAALGGVVFAAWWNVQFRQPRYLPRRHSQRHRVRSYRVQAEAERRAEEMLRALLGEEQFTHFVHRGYLEVQSPTFPNRVYLIPERQGLVTVCEQGRPIMRLCVQCIERVPDYDTVAMHKLMIEGNEREYLRVANRV